MSVFKEIFLYLTLNNTISTEFVDRKIEKISICPKIDHLSQQARINTIRTAKPRNCTNPKRMYAYNTSSL